MTDEQKQLNSIWTPANVVTCVRIVFIPVFMACALNLFTPDGAPGPLLSAASFLLFVLLSLTDKVDGYLARSRHEITDFGKFLDPIADKILVFSAILILVKFDLVSVWAAFIILTREFLVSAMRMVAGANGVVIAADTLGKWKTATTMAALSGYFLYYWLLAVGLALAATAVLWLSHAFMAVAVVLTVVSGAQYLWNARDIIFRV